MSEELVEISMSDVNKKVGPIIDRVLRGERFIVCRHNRPVATLQPLDVNKLNSVQQALPRDCVGRGRVVTSGLGGHGAPEVLNDLELLRLQGQDTIDAWLG